MSWPQWAFIYCYIHSGVLLSLCVFLALEVLVFSPSGKSKKAVSLKD